MAFTRTFAAREDSGSANNPALNLTGAPATEITFVNETSTGDPGDLFLEGGGTDPDTVVEIDGVTYTFQLELSATLPTQNRDGARQVPDQFEGELGYIVTVFDYPTVGDTIRFFFMPDANATLAEMDAFGNRAIDLQNVDNNPAPVPFALPLAHLS